MLEHIRAIQTQILDKPYMGKLRANLTSEVATEHLIEQLNVIGSEPPPQLLQAQAVSPSLPQSAHGGPPKG